MAIRKSCLLYADEMSKQSKAFKNFARGINSLATKTDYTQYLKNFMAFHKLGNDFDGVVKSDAKEIDEMIINYLDSLVERGVKGITQRTHLMGIERLFIMNDCIWHKDRIRRGIKKDEEISGGNVPITTEEISQMLECTKSVRSKALIHFLASTGMRPAGLTDPILKIKHLIPMSNPDDIEKKKWCYAIRIYDESKFGYWGFLTPEAVKILDNFIQSRKLNGEEITPESPIFTTIKKTNTIHQNLTDGNARYIIYNLIKQSGLIRTKVSNTRYDKAMMYMFRKRFNTILKLNNDVNSNIAEKLMAHKKGLDGTYLQPTREECFTEFVKSIPELLIDSSQRKQAQIDKITREKSELEKKEPFGEINDLKRKYEITNQKLELVLGMIENAQKNKSQIFIDRRK